MAIVLDGKSLSLKMIEAISGEISLLKAQGQATPKLVVIQVGEDKASSVYVKNKQNACLKAGIASEKIQLSETASQRELLEIINELNHSSGVHGMIVQLPLPPYISENAVLDAISPEKDVDGFHPINIGKLAQKRPQFRSCTPFGIIRLFAHYDISLTAKHVLVIGASNIVGRPMVLELMNAGATVTSANSKTKNLQTLAQNADIVIMATGKRDLLSAHDFRDDAVVIDVGIHKLSTGILCGDLDFESISPKVAYMTPVPGGVGPLTVSCLLQNTLQAYRMQTRV